MHDRMPENLTQSAFDFEALTDQLVEHIPHVALVPTDSKYCPRCKQRLPTDYFGKQSSSKDGLQFYCRSCQSNMRTATYARRKEQGLCTKCLAPTFDQSGLCKQCNEKLNQDRHSNLDATRAINKRHRDKLRDEVFSAYGGKCIVCGESHPAFLSVDHINNDGAAHRRITGNGHRLYQWLRKNGFPQEGFQLLCTNHNWLKHISHQPDEKTYVMIWNANLREETLAAYGGKCVCCGESQADVLTIDHVNSDGAEHRKTTGGGSSFYSWLRKNGFPQDGRFQVLCFNCNRAKFYHGVCPHQIRDS